MTTDRTAFTDALAARIHAGIGRVGPERDKEIVCAHNGVVALWDAKQAECDTHYDTAQTLLAQNARLYAECDRLRAALRHMPPDTFVERVFRTAERMVEGSDFTVAVTAFEAAAIRALLAPAKGAPSRG